jgi:hypothetical protein
LIEEKSFLEQGEYNFVNNHAMKKDLLNNLLEE